MRVDMLCTDDGFGLERCGLVAWPQHSWPGLVMLTSLERHSLIRSLKIRLLGHV